MTIQAAIDQKVAEIEAAYAAKLGAPCKIRFTFERDYTGIVSARVGTCAPDYLNLSGYGLHDIDEALGTALATVRTMRTAEDERADLYAGMEV